MKNDPLVKAINRVLWDSKYKKEDLKIGFCYKINDDNKYEENEIVWKGTDNDEWQYAVKNIVMLKYKDKIVWDKFAEKVTKSKTPKKGKHVKKDSRKMGMMQFLPKNTMLTICEFLKLSDYTHLQKVSRRWNGLFKGNWVWMNHYMNLSQMQGNTLKIFEVEEKGSYWKEQVKQRKKLSAWSYKIGGIHLKIISKHKQAVDRLVQMNEKANNLKEEKVKDQEKEPIQSPKYKRRGSKRDEKDKESQQPQNEKKKRRGRKNSSKSTPKKYKKQRQERREKPVYTKNKKEKEIKKPKKKVNRVNHFKPPEQLNRELFLKQEQRQNHLITLKSFADPITCMETDDSLLIAGTNNCLRIFDIKNGNRSGVIKKSAQCLDFDKQLLIYGTYNGFRFYDLYDNVQLKSVKGDFIPKFIKISRPHFLSAQQSSMTLWDLDTTKEIITWKQNEYKEQVTGLELVNQNYAVKGTSAGNLFMHDFRNLETLQIGKKAAAAITSITHNDELCIVGDDFGKIRIFDIRKPLEPMYATGFNASLSMDPIRVAANGDSLVSTDSTSLRIHDRLQNDSQFVRIKTTRIPQQRCFDKVTKRTLPIHRSLESSYDFASCFLKFNNSGTLALASCMTILIYPNQNEFIPLEGLYRSDENEIRLKCVGSY